MLCVPVRSILAFQSRTVCCVAIKSNGLIYPNNTNFTIAKRHAVTDFVGVNTKSKISDFINRFQIMNPLNKSKYEANSWILYEKLVDQIPFDQIMIKLDLPDTFNSWFIITELHLWMIFVRFMHEGTQGTMIRNFIMEALWNDVEFRSKKLATVNADVRHRQIKELSDQLRGALVGYDEGWLTNDMVLASMVWRRVFNKECNDPEKIELVVKYIRKQMSILQLQTFDSLFTKKDVKWIKFV
ncbi:ubiquinol-cytochrome-c reductase complex assembly factor 1 isoform X1 [Myzus persicae]|uniref:ubiquinol-cytochrome-c reductase complex assembly factor 1 isoform X1 n=1 Tax=Myzus persicae TaxID=13164 RepID=UPI000B939A87|nr:ubiquinol-cytochrome-c reductase complex assembly factor 1 isoform X1 [Myzus persicae]